MIKTLLIEDELPARKKLLRYIQELDLPISVIAELETVESGIEFFKSKPILDLIISDIELRDGNAFAVFEKTQISCPIIFTTAYNEFWMDAFESNGIAYLIKPFSREKFYQAWEKFMRITQNPEKNESVIQQLNFLISRNEQTQKAYKSRLNIPTIKGSIILKLDEVRYFSAEHGILFAIDQTGKRLLLKEGTLKEIEDFLDPSAFFRINRSQIIHKKFVVGTERNSKNNLDIKLEGTQEMLICSQRQIPVFLNWIEE
ncbi:LytTR family DNA-binding domain-containing protein [Algoriphagus confluentis]|uniref:LytTR family DNA-binding domain-containing protein n=1 Tax=Algoriphagus confluentis TaxID=1697556 RepID=A0ABQ6PRK8_9BACT|nr:LytTR family DNA-binding domain-containing protein [Algoriphagus confluentis]